MKKSFTKRITMVPLLVVTLMIVVCQGVFAQALTVKGKVTAADDSSPIPGVNVLAKGTTQGTTTDASGNFTLSLTDSQATLVLSFIGYATQEVAVNGRTIIDVVLDVDSQTLQEVIVTGYTSQLKREVTGAVQTVKGSEFTDIPVSQIGQKLQGRLAGVQINQTTGKPGQGMNIRIRGQLSVSAGSDPLYVIDGFPITGNIGQMNPDEIEDITVLKDAASTSLYGSRAANGVVLITTKKGKAGKTNISFNAFAGMQEVPRYNTIDMMNSVEFAQFKKEYYEDAGQPVPPEFVDPSFYADKDNDWYGALLQEAPLQSYNLTITTNTDKLKTAVVAGIFNQQGVVLNTEYKRYSLRLNTEYAFSDKIKMGFNLAPNYIYDNTPRTDGNRGTGILFNALHTWPIMPIYEANGELTKVNRFPGSTGNIFSYPNWVRAANELVNETTNINLLSNAFVQIEPLKGLVIKSSINAEMLSQKFFFFNPSTATSAINVPIPTTAVSIRQDLLNFSLLNENIVTYSKKMNDHSFEILGGLTNQTFRQEITRIQADTYANDQLPTIQGAININRGGTNSNVQEWALTSLLTRLSYNYKGKYLFTAALRRDGSSRFGSENRWGNFPSLSAGWVMSDEGFFSGIKMISLAKLRASYGVVGNNNIGNYNSQALINNTINSVFGSTVASGAAVTTLENSNLGWETTKQLDIGLDLGLYNDRITLSYDYYIKNTTNLLFSVQVAQESGFTNYNDNIGEIKFWGHEFAINTLNTTGKVKWTTQANISFNRNEVVALAPGIDRVYGVSHITKVGEPFGQFYGHISQGVYLNAEDLANSPKVPGRSTVGSIKLTDQNGDGIITNGGDFDDRVIMGNPFPDFVWGMTNNVTYGNFDFNVLISGSEGNSLLATHLFSTANLDGVFNMIDGPVSTKDRFRSVSNPGKGFYGTTVGGGNVTGIERDWMNSRFVVDASHLTIRNVTLGYTIPAKTNWLKSARIYASVQQLYVFTNYWGGNNPETSAQNDGEGDGGNLSPGRDLSNYPIPRTWSLGVNLNF